MKQNRKNSAAKALLIGSICAAVLAVAASVLYFFAYRNCYDVTFRHYETGCAFPYIYGFMMLGVAVIFGVVALYLNRPSVEFSPEVKNRDMFGLWLCAFMFIVFALYSLFGSTADATAVSFKEVTAVGRICDTLLPPLALLSALSLFLAVSDRTRCTTLHAVAAFSPVLWSIGLVLKYYFDLDEMTLNDPELNLTMVALAGLVVFFLNECRFALGIATAATTVFAASVAIFLTGGITVARCVLFRTDALVIPTPIESAVFLASVVLAVCRLISLYSHLKHCTPSSDECYECECGCCTSDTSDTDCAL